MRTLDRPETHQHGRHTLIVHAYYTTSMGKVNGAKVTIDGQSAQLILNGHGELDARPFGVGPDHSGDLLQGWREAGLVESVLRGYSAAPDDAEVWLGPVPRELVALVR